MRKCSEIIITKTYPGFGARKRLLTVTIQALEVLADDWRLKLKEHVPNQLEISTVEDVVKYGALIGAARRVHDMLDNEHYKMEGSRRFRYYNSLYYRIGHNDVVEVVMPVLRDMVEPSFTINHVTLRKRNHANSLGVYGRIHIVLSKVKHKIFKKKI